ncbi:glycoside hydrolase family 31 protein [Bacillus carboniphilus]|uniref:Glycoside hydrolase family 31 protein n=1 Tax=Bacillus carboniphilus TaxID=86663 RepID=A0ABN0VQA0_9BACI
MLEDTSFAIHPGQQKQNGQDGYKAIGPIVSYKKEGNLFNGTTENGELAIAFKREDIVHIEMNPFGKATLPKSPAIIVSEKDIDFKIDESNHSITLSTGALTVVIQKDPLLINILDGKGEVLVQESKSGMAYKETREVICYKEMEENDHFYGFGEKTGFLDKRGEKMVMWNSDVYAPHNPETDSLYESIPFFTTLRDGKAFGIFFDNTFKTTFDLRSETDRYSFGSEGGTINYYVFAGPTMKNVLEQYTYVTGRSPIPPKWSIGYHQSRYSYESEQEVRELVKLFKEKNIPIDVVHLDIHYMEGYRVFTFDKNRFPNPKQLIQDLKEQGIHVVPIVDPGVKEDSEYPIYQEGVRNDLFCKYIEGNIYFGEVWPGNSAFPDFTSENVRKWWGEKHEFYTDLGIEGIWNDMNEPAVFNETKTMDLKVIHDNDGNPKSHRELHNIYGLLMGKSTYEGMKDQLSGKRPFLLTRAGYSGVQRYAAVWTGDNRSFWEHLQMAIPMVMNLGVSGVPFAGPDVGGFAHDSNGELLARWTQVGALTPFFRNHSALGFVRQEPWSFGEKYEEVVRKYIQLRYQWLPQLYTLFKEASQSGLPVMRPLVMEYPNDENTVNLYDQFMIGDNVIVAPIVKPTDEYRVVYLPEGTWYDFWTGEVLEGGKRHLIHAPLDKLPIYVLAGTAIAQGNVRMSTEEKEATRTVHLYYSNNSEYTFTMYEDDGSTFAFENGEYLDMAFTITQKDGSIQMTSERSGSFKPEWESFHLVLHGAQEHVKIEFDGVLLEEQEKGKYSLKM